jgi:ribose transport system substrate-binding protein
MRSIKLWAAAVLGAAALFGLGSQAAMAEKTKVYYSMGFVGNNWMTEARNMITALAKSKRYRDEVDFEVQSAGGNAQQQIQQISGMVQAGAKAIIIYPINEAALRQVIAKGCKAGVDFYVINGAPDTCAYSFTSNGYGIGKARMDWMAKQLKGKGNVVVFTGIPGTTFSDETQRGVDASLKDNPGIKVLATLNGEWSNQTTRVRMQELLATKSWDDIDGVVAAEACYTILQMQLEAKRSPDKLVPCTAQDENGFRLAMLAKGTTPESYGMPGFSTDSMIWVIPMALKEAVDKIEGKNVPKVNELKTGAVDNATVKFCQTGSTSELQAGCNVFPPNKVPNDWQAGFWNAELSELDFNAVNTGEPSK